MKAALWGLKTEKKRRTPANISFSLPRRGNSTWYWLEPSPESSNVAIPVSNNKETNNTSASAVNDSSVQPDEIPSLSNLVEATTARAKPDDADEESSECSEESDITYVSYQRYKNNHEQGFITSSDDSMTNHNDDDNWNINYSKLLALKEKFGQAMYHPHVYESMNPSSIQHSTHFFIRKPDFPPLAYVQPTSHPMKQSAFPIPTYNQPGPNRTPVFGVPPVFKTPSNHLPPVFQTPTNHLQSISLPPKKKDPAHIKGMCVTKLPNGQWRARFSSGFKTTSHGYHNTKEQAVEALLKVAKQQQIKSL